MTSEPSRRLIAEWEPQSAVLLAWPHANTDWATRLREAIDCFRAIVDVLHQLGVPAIVVTPDPDDLADIADRCTVVKLPTNDTWTRDYGPISVNCGNDIRLLDFTFNGWGLKFSADADNLVTQRLYPLLQQPPFGYHYENHRGFVLEGGAIETDGHGTLLTTTSCLCSPNRNAHLNPDEIEQHLKTFLGVDRVLWLHHGHLPGDDTDGHIDTLARFAPNRTILYATAQPTDPHYTDMRAMARELADIAPDFRRVPLPAPSLTADENGQLLPATYANYLVTNGGVLVPTYAQPDTDRQALLIIAEAFPQRKVIGIDCNELIRQHGSLHCSTMQLHKI